MGEVDIARLFDRLESMERRVQEKLAEIKVDLAEVKKDRDHFEERLSEQQEKISNVVEIQRTCEIQRALANGKAAAYMAAGAAIVFLMDRLQVWDALLSIIK